MALIRWTPFERVFDLHREMDQLFRRSSLMNGDGGRLWAPPVDVFTREGDLVVRVELPGVDVEKDVEVTLQAGTLTVKGTRSHSLRTEADGTFHVESAYGRFQRSVSVPDHVTEESIQASYRDGILEIVVAGAVPQQEVRRIPIQLERREIAAASAN